MTTRPEPVEAKGSASGQPAGEMMAEPAAVAEARDYFSNALENLDAAEADYAAQRYNACASRAYYCCFQAAIAALLAEGIVAPSRLGRWDHRFVAEAFANNLINRRKLYPGALGASLQMNITERHRADYAAQSVSGPAAIRALRRARTFVEEVGKRVSHDKGH